jgi:thiamine pyrophosphate-dependent acetolactate synthase large subunit-like protein
MQAYGRTTGVELRTPEFEPMAEAYGIAYRRLTGPAELGEALREAIAGLGQGSTLIELQAELAAPPQSL